MFAMKDQLERDDTLVGNLAFIYPSSLLYLVSGICEREDGKSVADQSILGMHRYYLSSYRIPRKRKEAIEAIKKYLDEGENRVIWSETCQGKGLNSLAVDHGDFDTEPETLKSVSHILGNGFD